MAQGVELFRTMVAASGVPCQRAYTAAISSLLRIKRKGLANKRCVVQRCALGCVAGMLISAAWSLIRGQEAHECRCDHRLEQGVKGLPLRCAYNRHKPYNSKRGVAADRALQAGGCQ